eukprot:187592-Pyramimonas_sp.AAC.2
MDGTGGRRVCAPQVTCVAGSLLPFASSYGPRAAPTEPLGKSFQPHDRRDGGAAFVGSAHIGPVSLNGGGTIAVCAAPPPFLFQLLKKLRFLS